MADPVSAKRAVHYGRIVAQTPFIVRLPGKPPQELPLKKDEVLLELRGRPEAVAFLQQHLRWSAFRVVVVDPPALPADGALVEQRQRAASAEAQARTLEDRLATVEAELERSRRAQAARPRSLAATIAAAGADGLTDLGLASDIAQGLVALAQKATEADAHEPVTDEADEPEVTGQAEVLTPATAILTLTEESLTDIAESNRAAKKLLAWARAQQPGGQEATTAAVADETTAPPLPKA